MSVTRRPAMELPPNIKEFNEITAVILAELYKSHPKPATIETNRVAQILGKAPSDVLPSGRTFQDMEVHTLYWLAAEGFVTQMGGLTTAARCTLTARTLAGIKAAGPELAAAADQGSSEAGKQKLTELMGNFFGAFTGSVVKALASS
jgi:hypothetical protein